MATPTHRTAPGSSYFVTTKCWQGHAVFQIPKIAQMMVQTLLHYREQNAYSLHEFVVMPNHLHVLLTQAANTSLEKAVQLIKGGSSHAIHKQCGHKMEIWQEGFHDWTIRDAADWHAKVEYIRFNPVRAKLVSAPEEWPYSSAAPQMALDPIPARYKQLSSGAKAPFNPSLTPGLKSRPPEPLIQTMEEPRSKSRPPELLIQTRAEPRSKSRWPETSARGAGEGLKSRPPEERNA